MSEKQKRVVLEGIEIPQWYLELEPRLLEQMDELEKMNNKLKSLRATILSIMEDGGVDVIKSEFAVVTRVKDSIVETISKDKLKEEMPEVYAKYVKTSHHSGGLKVKLVKEK